MKRTEECELTVLCMLHDGDRVLMQDRVGKSWAGYTFPGGHIEQGESVVDAVVREMREETGLTVLDPRICGVKQFPLKDGDYANGRYIVFLFEAAKFSGELVSSDEGEMHWVDISEIGGLPTVDDFGELMEVMCEKDLSEFMYVVEKGEWRVIRK
ncbi:8-oxo-dGTP diphosphatase [uncultured Ruminococcus sp.]|uniref:8-oxo-dGTP diphosphatase n=1 Tax=uncultured Ruminococcus sp. TaxID=165186 RepID=UPI000EC7E2E0|nr:8-oxo-dGTP diphosphatase [uncultured Ruminococcus sp.]HCJ41743.1 DNA mismatch repair protein MutT [Ruminococcus sp.]